MYRKILKWIHILAEAQRNWKNKDPFRQSAVIAYYAVFSIPSLLVIVIAVAGYFWGHDIISAKVMGIISGYLGQNAANQIKDTLSKSGINNKAWYSMAIGLFSMITGATGVLAELQQLLDDIWEVQPDPNKKIIKSILDNVFSFGLVLSIAFLMLISLALTAFITSISTWINAYFSIVGTIFLHILDFVISFGVITVLFALIFKVLPDARIKWRYIWIGAMLTSLLFVIGKYALGIYFGKFHPESAYGVAGSIVLVLLWFSYSSMILFYGAEFTKQVTLYHERKIMPKKNALPAEPEK